MGDHEINSPLDALASYLKEKDNNFTSTDELQDFCSIAVQVEKTSLHVAVAEHCQRELTWRAFPKNGFSIPDAEFDPEGIDERNRDFLLANISADGLMLSEKAKGIFEQFNLGNHRFYPVTIYHNRKSIFKKTERYSFYWLHLIFDENRVNYVDFSDSIFLDKVSVKGKEISAEEITFPSLDSWDGYRKEKYQLWREDSASNPLHELSPKRLRLLKSPPVPDLFGLGRIDSGNLYVKREMAEAILESGLRGLRIKGTTKIKMS